MLFYTYMVSIMTVNGRMRKLVMLHTVYLKKKKKTIDDTMQNMYE